MPYKHIFIKALVIKNHSLRQKLRYLRFILGFPLCQ